MGKLESSISDLAEMVQAGVKIQEKLSESRLALIQQQQKAARDAFLEAAEEKERRAAQLRADDAKAIANLSAMLEQFHPNELLAQVNNTQDVWRGVGVVEKRPVTSEDVSYELSAKYERSYSQTDGDSGTSVNKTGKVKTFLEIGVSNALYKKYADGKFYHGGFGLYVCEQDAPLWPVAPADQFKDLVPKGLRKDPGDGSPPHIVIFDVDHPQASDMLTEILARSCINRVARGKEPWKMVGSSSEEIKSPTSTPNRSWWSRIIG